MPIGAQARDPRLDRRHFTKPSAAWYTTGDRSVVCLAKAALKSHARCTLYSILETIMSAIEKELEKPLSEKILSVK